MHSRSIQFISGMIVCVVLWISSVSAQETTLQIIDTITSTTIDSALYDEAKTLQLLLAQYSAPYEIVSVNRNRARLWVKQRPNACIPWLRRTAVREKDYWFSLPYMVESAVQLVSVPGSATSQQLQQLADQQGQIDLTTLLQANKIPQLGIELARSYGDNIDPLFSQFSAHNRLYLRASPNEQVGNLLAMLHKGYIDITLEYPKIVARSGLALKLWPIKQATAFNLVYFACSQYAESQITLARLNQLIQQLATQRQYQQLALAGISAEQQAVALKVWQKALNDAPSNND